MKSIIITMLLFLATSVFSYSQKSVYKSMKKFAEKQGWTYLSDHQFYLRQGEKASPSFTLKGGREYKIFAFGEFSDVSDVDCWLYDEAGTLISKDVGDEGIAIVTISVSSGEATIKVVMKNISSSPPGDSQECRILITYR